MSSVTYTLCYKYVNIKTFIKQNYITYFECIVNYNKNNQNE